MAATAGVPFKVEKFELATGARSPVVELAKSAGFAADERAYAYGLTRNRSMLYEVRSN